MSQTPMTPEVSAALPDGTAVVVRPLVPGDAPTLVEGFAKLSADTRHKRFLGGVRRLPPQHVYAITHADGATHLVWGLAAIEGGLQIGVGVAHVIRDPDAPGQGEFAIVIADRFQHRGAGLALTHAIARRSWEIGVRRWTATMFLDNRPVQRLIASVANEVSRTVLGCGVAEVVYQLRPPSEVS